MHLFSCIRIQVLKQVTLPMDDLFWCDALLVRGSCISFAVGCITTSRTPCTLLLMALMGLCITTAKLPAHHQHCRVPDIHYN